jgi:hypothetical protein
MKAFISALIAALVVGVVAAAILDNLGMTSASTYASSNVRL